MKTVYGALLTASAQLSKVLVGFVLLKMIAYYFGAAGLGSLGHFMSMVSITTMLAGGGITNGVIKYVAEYKRFPSRLFSFISASAVYSVWFSGVFFFLGVSFSRDVAGFVFGREDYYWVIICLSFAQLGFAFSNLVVGVTNGLRDTQTYAKIQILGNAFSLPIAYFLIKYYGLEGAAIGVLVVFFTCSIPAYYFFRRSLFFERLFKAKAIRADYKKLMHFTVMLSTSALAFPVVEIIVRERLIIASGYADAGIWQGGMRLSSAYLGFFGIFLAYYFMPLISAEADKGVIKGYVFRFLVATMALFVFGAVVLYFGRGFFIPLLLSEDFHKLQGFIIFQLIGDFFRISSYVIGFVGVAKAATKLYVSAEAFQSLGFLGASTLLGLYLPALNGVFFGYMLIYILYFFLSFAIFLRWASR